MAKDTYVATFPYTFKMRDMTSLNLLDCLISFVIVKPQSLH